MADAAVLHALVGKQATKRENLRQHQDSHLLANVARRVTNVFVHDLKRRV